MMTTGSIQPRNSGAPQALVATNFSLSPVSEAQPAQKITPDQEARLANETGNLAFGDPNSSQVVYAVMDYNCVHCRNELNDLLSLTAENPDTRVVLKNFPILGSASEDLEGRTPSQDAALAAATIAEGPELAPDQTLQFLQSIASSEVRLDQNEMMNLYEQAAGSETRRELDKRLPVQNRAEKMMPFVEANHALARELGINGTPAIIFNGEVLEDRSTLRNRINDAQQRTIQNNLEVGNQA
jgi:protein-disulfide isomerase